MTSATTPSASAAHAPEPTRLIEGAAKLAARRIANAADADQYAIAIVGVPGLGPPDFDERVPRAYLVALNDGRPAIYRLTIVLRTPGVDVGIIRLGTMRPCGFSTADIDRARDAAASASEQLARLLVNQRGAPVNPRGSRGGCPRWSSTDDCA